MIADNPKKSIKAKLRLTTQGLGSCCSREKRPIKQVIDAIAVWKNTVPISVYLFSWWMCRVEI